MSGASKGTLGTTMSPPAYESANPDDGADKNIPNAHKTNARDRA